MCKFMKLSEALIKYSAYSKFKKKLSSMSTYYNHLRIMVLYFHDCGLEEVTLDGVIQHMTMMKELGWDERTFTAKASAYKDFFFFFKKQGFKVPDPELIPIPSFDRKIPEFITEEEHEILINIGRGYRHFKGLRAVLVLSLLKDTGVRLNELRSLDVSDMDTTKRRAIIKTEKSKGMKPLRMIYWTKETNDILKEYIKLRGAMLKERKVQDIGALLISAHGRWNKFGFRWSETAIEAFMQKLSYVANLGKTFHPHMYRHAFGRHLAMGPNGDGVGGANAYVIKNLMGHANVASSDIYTVMNEEMMEKVHRRFFKK